MIKPSPKALRCAIYTRVSTEHGLEQDFNSLDAQREAGRAYVKSQTHEGWRLVKESFDDGGSSSGSAMLRVLMPRGRRASITARTRPGAQHAERMRRIGVLTNLTPEHREGQARVAAL